MVEYASFSGAHPGLSWLDASPELERSLGTTHGHFMANTCVPGSDPAPPPAADAGASLIWSIQGSLTSDQHLSITLVFPTMTLNCSGEGPRFVLACFLPTCLSVCAGSHPGSCNRSSCSGTLTVQIRLIQDLGLDDLLNDILQGDNAHHLVERVSFPFIVHPLHDGQVGLSCEGRAEWQ